MNDTKVVRYDPYVAPDVTNMVRDGNGTYVTHADYKALEERGEYFRKEWSKAEGEVERLTAELAECRKDAERYRWLQTTNPHRFKKIQDASVIDATDVHYFQKHEFDAQVDQAIARTKA